MPLLRVRERPALRRPMLLAAFGGWGDAGGGATGALSYLLGDPPPTACATLDPEACFDFTVERPVTSRGGDGRWRLEYPEIGFFPIMRPDRDRDLLVLRGPEPHTNWPTLSGTLAEFASDQGVDLALTLGAFIGAVSHRQTPLVRRTPSRELDARLAGLGFDDTSYAGPTAFVTAILHDLDAVHVPAASLWAAAPPYLGSPNPALSLALLEGVEQVADTTLDLGRLRGLSTDFVRKVEAALQENPEVAQRLGQLVDLTGPEPFEPEPPIPEGPPDLPSGRDLADELERYFRESRGNADSQAG